MLDATVMRQEAIASNLANIETPNYKRIDIDSSFGEALSRAIGTKNVSDIQRLTPTVVMDKYANAPNRDGNTVQLEAELLKQQENTLAHNVQTQLASSALLKLKYAITGRAV